MARFTPIIGNLTGKIGGMVIDKNGVVRLFVSGCNRVPREVKNCFSMLAKQWPFSSIEYKELVQDSPGVVRGIGCVTGRSYGIYSRRQATEASYTEDAKGIVPERLADLPPEYSGVSTLRDTIWNSSWPASEFLMTISFGEAMPTVVGSNRVAWLCMDILDSCAGRQLNAIAGATIVVPGGTNSTLLVADSRLATLPAGRAVVFFGAVYGQQADIDLPVVYAYASGVIIVGGGV